MLLNAEHLNNSVEGLKKGVKCTREGNSETLKHFFRKLINNKEQNPLHPKRWKRRQRF